jgi:signal transduction histidine kinase
MSKFFNSMAGRVFLRLVGGILASAALTLLLANRERHEFLDHVRTFHSAERMVQIVTMLEAIPGGARAKTLQALNKTGLMAEITATGKAAEGIADPLLANRLHQRLGVNRQVTAVRSVCLPQVANTDGHSNISRLCLTAYIALGDGSTLKLTLPPQPDRPATSFFPHLALYGLMFAGSLGLLAYGVTRMSTRPLRLLAQAATELGKNIGRPPLVESGPAEVREAASAFNSMQGQVQSFIQERTQMLAAITHDLQTPLTRLRLRLEKVQDEDLRDKLTGDLSSMQDMIRDGLDLAKSMDSGEAVQRIDFDSLLNSLCDDAVEAGQDVSLEGETHASISAQPNGIRRCLTNLIDNAVKYGGYARLNASCSGRHVIVGIRDGGPGIPENDQASVFTPFFRLESSRSRETGGTGIGLTIARNIAVKHGGTVYLRNHPQGGLEATLELPVS